MGVANLFTSCEHDHAKRVALFAIDGKLLFDMFIFSKLAATESVMLNNSAHFSTSDHFTAIQAANETLIDLDDPSIGFVQIRVG